VTAVVRRASERFVIRREGLELRHSFSFGEHYDPDNVSFGLLLASNEMLLEPGAGFDLHEHRDLEIVTWVVSGLLEHRDSAGHVAVIGPGMAQRLSAGSGILHTERASAASPAHVVQMWVAPEESGLDPSYEQRSFAADLEPGGLVAIASGDARHEAALRIHQSGAVLYAARLAPGASVELPAAAQLHMFITHGTVHLPGLGTLDTADAVRMTDPSARQLESADEAEFLVWAMAPQPGLHAGGPKRHGGVSVPGTGAGSV
jgi:quercetin 2,3-dioxygenase